MNSFTSNAVCCFHGLEHLNRFACSITSFLGIILRLIVLLWCSNYFEATAYKLVVALEVLQHGYQILYTDVDVIILRDPRDFIRTSYFDYDLAFQAENKVVAEFYSINTGFFHAQPSESAKAALKQTIESVQKVSY